MKNKKVKKSRRDKIPACLLKSLKTPIIKDLVHVNYDYDGDVLYITFGTNEPSYTEETDDTVLIERGGWSELPTGFRVLNFRKNWFISRNVTNNAMKGMEK